MKKVIPFLLILLPACSTTRNAPNNSQILAEHVPPLKIFGVGHYSSNSIILTLIDANNQYFTVEAPVDTNYKIGKAYPLHNIPAN